MFQDVIRRCLLCNQAETRSSNHRALDSYLSYSQERTKWGKQRIIIFKYIYYFFYYNWNYMYNHLHHCSHVPSRWEIEMIGMHGWIVVDFVRPLDFHFSLFLVLFISPLSSLFVFFFRFFSVYEIELVVEVD